MTVVCAGKCAVDWIVRLEGFPEPDSRQPIRELVTTFGGNAATASVALARLGTPVSFVGSVGDDDGGNQLRYNFMQERVNFAGLVGPAGSRSARSIILSEAVSGLRTILFEDCTAPVPNTEHLTEALQGARWLHLDGSMARTLSAGVLAGLRRGGPSISIDAGMPVPALRSLLPAVDLVVVPQSQLETLFPGVDPETGVRALQNWGASIAVVTLGSRGCAGAHGDGPVLHVPAFQVEVIDTTGAGDVFCGALVHALVSGQDVATALTFASAAAALSCRGIGGPDACPTRAEVEAFLAAAPPGVSGEVR